MQPAAAARGRREQRRGNLKATTTAGKPSGSATAPTDHGGRPTEHPAEISASGAAYPAAANPDQGSPPTAAAKSADGGNRQERTAADLPRATAGRRTRSEATNRRERRQPEPPAEAIRAAATSPKNLPQHQPRQTCQRRGAYPATAAKQHQQRGRISKNLPAEDGGQHLPPEAERRPPEEQARRDQERRPEQPAATISAQEQHRSGGKSASGNPRRTAGGKLYNFVGILQSVLKMQREGEKQNEQQTTQGRGKSRRNWSGGKCCKRL